MWLKVGFFPCQWRYNVPYRESAVKHSAASFTAAQRKRFCQDDWLQRMVRCKEEVYKHRMEGAGNCTHKARITVSSSVSLHVLVYISASTYILFKYRLCD